MIINLRYANIHTCALFEIFDYRCYGEKIMVAADEGQKGDISHLLDGLVAYLEEQVIHISTPLIFGSSLSYIDLETYSWDEWIIFHNKLVAYLVFFIRLINYQHILRAIRNSS